MNDVSTFQLVVEYHCDGMFLRVAREYTKTTPPYEREGVPQSHTLRGIPLSSASYCELRL